MAPKEYIGFKGNTFFQRKFKSMPVKPLQQASDTPGVALLHALPTNPKPKEFKKKFGGPTVNATPELSGPEFQKLGNPKSLGFEVQSSGFCDLDTQP